MKTYCIVCKKDTENKNPKAFKTKNGILTLKSICSVCNNEGTDVLSSLGIRTPLSKIPGLNILFQYKKTSKENNEFINKFLLFGDKFMPEMHLWDPKIKKYFASGPFNKHKERTHQFVQDGRLSHLHKNQLHKLVFNMMLHITNIKI